MKHSHRIFHLFFAVLFLGFISIGLFVYRDYGVSIDEYSQIDIGRVNYERIMRGSLEVQTHFDKYYGPVFEVPLYVFSTFVADPVFGMDEMSSRRLTMFLFFAFSIIFYYRFLSLLFDHPVYGLIGAIMLVLSPRIFAESFYNTKDIAFLSAGIFVLWALARMKSIEWKHIVLLSLTTGFAMAMRAQGLLMLGVVMMALVAGGKEHVRTRVFFSLVYGGVALCAAYLMFPVFWNDTLKNSIGYWQSSANPIGVPTYYFGTSYISPNIPWHYHFVWVAVTNTLSVLITFLFGIVWFAIAYFRKNFATHTYNRSYIAMALIILGTFMTSVLFHPRSYDGWRHIYYIYPSMIGFSIYAMKELFHGRKTHAHAMLLFIVAICISIDLLGTMKFMIKNHPNQYVYFNSFVGGYARAKANFDFDYWGISYKQLHEYLEHMPVLPSTHVYFDQPFPYTEKVMIPMLQKRGASIVQSIEEANVYVMIGRDIKTPPPSSFYNAYAVTVEGVHVSGIYFRTSIGSK